MGSAAALVAQAADACPPMSFFISSTTPTGSGNLGGVAAPTRFARTSRPPQARATGRGMLYLDADHQRGPGVNARGRIGAGPWYNAKA